DGPHMPLLAPMLVVLAVRDGADVAAAGIAAANEVSPPPPPPNVPPSHTSSSTPGPSLAAQDTPVTKPTPVRDPTPSLVREPTPFREPTPDSPRPPSPPPPYPRSEELASMSLGGNSTVEAAYTIYKASQDAHASSDAGHDPAEVPADTIIPFKRTSTTRRRLKKPFTSSASEHFPENISAVKDTLPAGEGIPAAAPTIPADWLELMAKIATNSALSKQLLGNDVNEENMNERLGMLLIRKRRELAEQSRVKPMNKTQQQDFIRDFLKNQSAAVYNQGWTMKQVYMDGIIFGFTNQAWCDEFKVLMKGEFEMNAMGELTFFLGLQVKQLHDGIFISQDKYVKDMLRKFDMESVRTATTPYEVSKPKSKDESDDAVNVHLYRSMIGSLMYLTASRPDIMFVVSACSRYQVTPMTSHLNVVKKIFKYLKGQPNLGLWY
nr:copia protein [Tanacetum cinerariifolium]